MNKKSYKYYKMDLYGADGNAVAMGNARRQQVRDLNERIKAHNDDVANQISGLMDQEKTTQKINDAKNLGQSLWVGSSMPDRIKSYNDWVAGGKKTTNPLTEQINNIKSKVSSIGADAQQNVKSSLASATEQLQDTATNSLKAVQKSGANVLSSAPEGLAEGTNAGRTITGEISKVAGESGVGAEASSLLKQGMGLVEKGGDLTMGGLAKSGLSKLGGAAGVFGETAMAGVDIYDDIKAGGIAGNNNWEKAGNIMQIGGAVSDIVGTFFPPAKLLGGVLDLASAGINTIGESEDTTDSDALKQKQQQETQQTISAPRQDAITTGRTE
jgi:hypothetical protein